MTEEKNLAALELYLKTGSHIGTTFKTGDMRRYIFKRRKDGLKVLDVENIDKRIKMVAGFLSRFDAEKIAVVSRKLYGKTPVKMFAEMTGARALTGRFVPGTFTNPSAKEFVEPTVVMVTDPESDAQAIAEATSVRVPVVALCSTNSYLRNIDLIIPINNKGRKSLALAYWLLAREFLKNKGLIKEGVDFGKTMEDFEYKMKDNEKEEAEEEDYRPQKRPRFDRRDDRGRGRSSGSFRRR